MSQYLRRAGPKAKALFFAFWIATFFFAWSVLASDDSFGASLVGAVVGAAVGGALFYWISSIAAG